eukprot:s1261_g35.t1
MQQNLHRDSSRCQVSYFFLPFCGTLVLFSRSVESAGCCSLKIPGGLRVVLQFFLIAGTAGTTSQTGSSPRIAF